MSPRTRARPREPGGRISHLFGGDGLLARLSEFLNGLLVVAQILLATDEDDGKALAEVKDLGDPLGRGHVLAEKLI